MHTIAYITDIHIDEEFPIKHGVNARNNWEHILDDVFTRSVDKVVFGGDIGTPESNEYFFASFKELDKDLCITLGNHDKYADAVKYYEPDNTGNELYYVREDDRYTFIFMDSSSDSVSDIQLKWLEKELEAAVKQVIIFIHHPVLGLDTPLDKMYPLKNRDEVAAVIQQHKQVVTIFCGHYHMEDEQTVGNIRQFVTPAASYQIIKETDKLETSADTFGYRLIHFDERGMRTELILFDKKEA